MLRCLEIGITIRDLELYEVGEITNLIIERGNDGENYANVATQEDMDRF